MAEITYSVEGLAALQRNIQEHTRQVQNKILRRGVAAAAKVVVDAARANAPVDTGALKKSIGSRRDKNESRRDYEVRGVGVFRLPGADVSHPKKGKAVDPPTFYWKFAELGTVKQAARPFIGPALAQNIGPATTAMRQVIVDELAKLRP